MSDGITEKGNLEEQLRHLEDKAAIVLGVAGGVGAALLNTRLPEYLLQLDLRAIKLLNGSAWIAVVIAVWLALDGIAARYPRWDSSGTIGELKKAVLAKAMRIEASIRCLSISVALLALEYVWPPSQQGTLGVLFLAGVLGGVIMIVLRSSEESPLPWALRGLRFCGILLAVGASIAWCWFLSLPYWHGIGLTFAASLAGSQIAEVGSYIVYRNYMTIDELQDDETRELAVAALKALAAGKVVMLPLRVGFGYIGTRDGALRRIYELKGRSPDKPLCLLANEEIAREVCTEEGPSFATLMRVVHLGIPVTVITQARKGMEMPPVIENSIEKGLALYFDGGSLAEAIVGLAAQDGILIFGSSANISGHGNTFSWAELDNSLLEDVTMIGYPMDIEKPDDSGVNRGATIVNASSGSIIRRGLAADQIEGALRQFGIAA